MPSLDYLRSDSADEIDPRSDFAVASDFARFICSDAEPRVPFESIDRPSVADLRQAVALRLLEERARRKMPAAESCFVLVDSEPDLARQAFSTSDFRSQGSGRIWRRRRWFWRQSWNRFQMFRPRVSL